MLKTRILLVVGSALVIGLLFLLPKVVVENDSTLSSVADSVGSSIEAHVDASAEVKNAIQDLRRDYFASADKEKNAIFADSLATLYRNAGKFDSAAWFAEDAAMFFNNVERLEKAGDYYYEAYTFAVNKSKQDLLATKTQSLYNKVLEKKPTHYEVKTKLAMTYFTSANPMQGVVMLRDVLEADPKNELALYNLGMLSVQSGQNDRAVERLQELVAINPDHIQGQLLLGIAYLNLKKKREAKAQFEKVKLLDNDPAVQAAVDSYLKDLK
jgi:tetratricopeptide (TPR) repeat protein